MNRTEFTAKIVLLMFNMIKEDEYPIGDFWLRSAEEQNRLYQIGRDANGNKIGKILTERDGYKNPSAHQSGKALDIYFIEGGKMVPPKLGYEHWHSEWEKMGGQPMIEWDVGHFEG